MYICFCCLVSICSSYQQPYFLYLPTFFQLDTPWRYYFQRSHPLPAKGQADGLGQANQMFSPEIYILSRETETEGVTGTISSAENSCPDCFQWKNISMVPARMSIDILSLCLPQHSSPTSLFLLWAPNSLTFSSFVVVLFGLWIGWLGVFHLFIVGCCVFVLVLFYFTLFLPKLARACFSSYKQRTQS